MEFEWDDPKEALNVARHGVSFQEARTCWLDPLATLRTDKPHSTGEERYILLGASRVGRLLVTVFTERGGRYRIISSRCATRREIRDYEKGI